MKRFIIIAGFAGMTLAGCIQTKSEVDVKPVDINLNLSGTVNLNVNINDARQNMQQITGEAPARKVDLNDIGVADPKQSASSAKPPADQSVRFIYGNSDPNEIARALVVMFPDQTATEKQLMNNISGRIPQVRYLLDEHVVGESHTGLLAKPNAATTLSAADQAIFDAENSDREKLYAVQAAAKNSTRDEMGLSFYLARLGYAKKGDWYDVRNKAGKWEWTTWQK